MVKCLHSGMIRFDGLSTVIDLHRLSFLNVLPTNEGRLLASLIVCLFRTLSLSCFRWRSTVINYFLVAISLVESDSSDDVRWLDVVDWLNHHESTLSKHLLRVKLLLELSLCPLVQFKLLKEFSGIYSVDFTCLTDTGSCCKPRPFSNNVVVTHELPRWQCD